MENEDFEINEPSQEWNDNFSAVLDCVGNTYDELNETLCYLEELAKIDPEDEQFPKAIKYIKKTIKEYGKMFDTELGWRVLAD